MQRRTRKKCTVRQRVSHQVIQHEHTLLRLCWSLLLQFFLLYLAALLILSKFLLKVCIKYIPHYVREALDCWQDKRLKKKYPHVYHYGSYPRPKP